MMKLDQQSITYVKWEIEPLRDNEGFSVCEFIDGMPMRQVSVIGTRMITSEQAEEDPDIGTTLTEDVLEEDWEETEPELERVSKAYFDELWQRAHDK